ncbi:MAG: right-handed parallel beta-helix repeat-containing protein, partial [Proteobacteria bacterium]|nr:right-handed parallel beta-helix repeat-containing protein [Pseudomonadota bacterium]
LEGCVFLGNRQALRFRDSIAQVADSVFLGNLYAVHAFRCDLTFTGNTLEGNTLGGFLAKESHVVFRGNRLAGNRDGVRLKDPDSRAEIRGNRFGPSAEDHLSLAQVPAVVEGNAFEGAGLDLVSLEDAPARLVDNAFGPAGRDAVHLKGGVDVDARGNFWGVPDPAARIFDAAADPALGRVLWEPPRFLAPVLDLPGETW